MSPLDAAVLVAYYLALALLTVYGVHRLHLVRLRRRLLRSPVPSVPVVERWPSVTVQLPLFNEVNVAARLIDAVSAIEYPGQLDIQVLDDSTDMTSAIVAQRVAEWQARDVAIAHIRRTSRQGFKAGALAHGMELSDAELLAVFDADFVPEPDVLMRMVPWFGTLERMTNGDSGVPAAEPSRGISHQQPVGMVQARWGHLNRGTSLLTRAQAIYLDGHFAIESTARHLGGRFFNFNGTAGVWRREAVEAAGGWSSSTLTEDLDLSYRAQLAGWRFVFLPDVVVCAELPSALSGFQEQQHRWAKGSIQTARKLLPRIAASNLPLRVKTEAFFHLTNNSAYVLTLLIALLIVPAIAIRQRLGVGWTVLIDALLFAVSTGSVLLFYAEGQRAAGRVLRLREFLTVLPIGIGISIRNSAAVLEGAIHRGGYFRRTPKRGNANRETREQQPRLPIGEVALASFFLVALMGFVSVRQWASIPFLFLFLGGYLYVAVAALIEWSQWFRSRSA